MASDVKWIKIVTDIFDDEKILLIESMPEADSVIVIWFKLLCMAGKQNNGGVFMLNDRIAYTDEMLATVFRRPVNTVRLALSTFESFGMIEVINNTYTIPNWDKHQSLEKMEHAKERNRKRVAAYRERQKTKLLGTPQNDKEQIDGDCNALRNDYVQECNDTDKDIDKDIDKEIYKDKEVTRKRSSRFVAPTIDEVKAYCRDRQNGVDAERFVDYYTANGWQVGKNKMKDWKAAVRTWEKNSFSGSNNKGQNDQSKWAKSDGYTEEELPY